MNKLFMILFMQFVFIGTGFSQTTDYSGYFGEDLIHAYNIGDIESVKTLIASGANVNYQNNKGETILMMASGDLNKEIVELLMAEGADVNIQDQDGRTALIRASDRGRGLIFNYINLWDNIEQERAFADARSRETGEDITIDIEKIEWRGMTLSDFKDFGNKQKAIIRLLKDAGATE